MPSGRFKIRAPSVPVMTELKVHTYTAAEPGIFVNSSPLETRFLPEAPLNWLAGLGADAVAAELAA